MSAPQTYGQGEQAVTVLDEEEKVLAWRLYELERAGFDPYTALVLAKLPTFDAWRSAIAYKRNGATAAQALEIVQ